MVRYLALFALIFAGSAIAQDDVAEPSKPPHGASARAEVTVTIMRGEELRLSEWQDTRIPPSDRQEHRLNTDQIRIDFY